MKNSLAQNAIFSVIYKLCNVIFPLVSATYIARVLSPDGIGAVAYAQNTVSYFLMIAVLAIPQYGIRESAKYRDDPEKVNKLFSELMGINFLSTTVCVAAYWCFIQLVFPVDHLVYLIFGLDLVFNYINIDWFYQGREEYRYITLRSILVKAISLCALFLFVKTEADYPVYALILCLGIGCNYFFNVFHLRGKVKLMFHNLEPGRHMKPIMVLMLSSVAASLYSKVDITMLGQLSTNASVGFYTNAHKVISIVLTLVTAISAVFLPRLSYVYENDREHYHSHLTIGLKLVLLLAVPGCIGLIVVSQELTAVLFGSAFAPMAQTLQILSVFTIVKGVGDLLCYQAIISSGNEKELIASRVVAGLANVVLNAILIPLHGHQGAAIASVISELIVNGMLLRYSLSIARPDISRHFCITLALSTAAMAVTVMVVKSLIHHDLICLVISVMCGVVAFLLSMLISRNELAVFVLSKIKKPGKNN